MSTRKKLPARMYAPWDQQQSDKVWKMKESGYSYEEIAMQMGRTKYAIKQRIVLLREIHRVRGSASVAASTSTKRWKHGKRWSKREDARLQTMFNQGKTYQEIGDALGRASAGVSHRSVYLRKKKSIFYPNDRGCRVIHQGRRYNEQEDATILRLKAEQRTHQEIADILGGGRTCEGVSYRWQYLCRRSANSGREQKRARYMKKWTAKEDARLRQLKGNHTAYEDIGIRMGRSKKEVHDRWKKLNRNRYSESDWESDDDTDIEILTTNNRVKDDRKGSLKKPVVSTFMSCQRQRDFRADEKYDKLHNCQDDDSCINRHNLLSMEQIQSLQCGDRIDYRDASGQYLPAKVTMIGMGGAIMIHFEGRDDRGHVIANRDDVNQLQSFARYRSLSSKLSSTASKLKDDTSGRLDRDKECSWIDDIDSRGTKMKSELFQSTSNVGSMKHETASRKRRLNHIEAPIRTKRAGTSDRRVVVMRNDTNRGELISEETEDEEDPMVDLWSVYNVVDWFQQNGFIERKDPLIKMFYKRNIDGRKFLKLTSKNLIELGILDDHDCILHLITKLKE